MASTPAAGTARATNALQNVYYSSSTDGGRTWTPDVRITDRSIDRRLSDVWTTGVHGPVGLASTEDTVYVAWDDTRNAIADSKAQDIYSTRLRLRRRGIGGCGWFERLRHQPPGLGLVRDLPRSGDVGVRTAARPPSRGVVTNRSFRVIDGRVDGARPCVVREHRDANDEAVP